MTIYCKFQIFSLPLQAQSHKDEDLKLVFNEFLKTRTTTRTNIPVMLLLCLFLLMLLLFRILLTTPTPATARQESTQHTTASTVAHHRDRIERREIRATIRMAVIIGVFCVMWLGDITPHLGLYLWLFPFESCWLIWTPCYSKQNCHVAWNGVSWFIVRWFGCSVGYSSALLPE